MRGYKVWNERVACKDLQAGDFVLTKVVNPYTGVNELVYACVLYKQTVLGSDSSDIALMAKFDVTTRVAALPGTWVELEDYEAADD